MPRNSKIGLETYPYVNTRVRVMKSFMVKPYEYSKLIKMTTDEITKFMGETVYKKEVDELAMKFSGADLIEAALNLNASRSFSKLIRISRKEVELLVKEYLRRYDIYNIKTILRGKKAGIADEEIKRLLVPAGQLDAKALERLLLKESTKEIIMDSKAVNINKQLADAIDAQDKTNSLQKIENALDYGYYNDMIELSKRIPKEGKYIGDFIRTEIDILNIKILFRLKREKLDKNDIVKNFVLAGEKLSREKLTKLAGAADYDEIYAGLSGTGYDKALERCMDDVKNKNEFGGLEVALEKHWLKQAYLMLHKHPLSIGPILGYMIAKDIEIRNLRMLVRAKVLGLDEKFMTDSLVV